MKYNFNVPLGVPIYGTPKKHWLGSLIGGLVGGAFGMAGNAQNHSYTKEQQKLQSKLNKEEMVTSQGMQNAQQDWLMNTQYGKMVSGMKNAGLNPATANGTSPATPSVGHGSSGGVGPAAHGEGLGAAVTQGALAGKQAEMTDAQIDNIKAATDKLKEESKNTAADTKIKEWEADPRILKLRERGLDSMALKTYAEADVAKETVTKVAREADSIFVSMQLTKEEVKKCQADTAKTYTAILTDLQSLTESEQRVALLIAEQELTKEQKRTERFKQSELFASAEHHKAGAAYDRAGIVTRHQEARESKVRAAGQAIANKAAEWRQKVLEVSGSVTEQGALLGAKRIIGLFNPLDHVSFGGSTVTHN